jgi:hypothetical protein
MAPLAQGQIRTQAQDAQLHLVHIDKQLEGRGGVEVVHAHGLPLIVDTKGKPLRECSPVLPFDPGLDRGFFEIVKDMAGQVAHSFPGRPGPARGSGPEPGWLGAGAGFSSGSIGVEDLGAE